MENKKIDILRLDDLIIMQDLITQNQTYFKISELEDNFLISYENFNTLVNNKISNAYTQVYVSKEPVIRFVGITVDGINVNDFQEIAYDELDINEKEIFDIFYNVFTN